MVVCYVYKFIMLYLLIHAITGFLDLLGPCRECTEIEKELYKRDVGILYMPKSPKG